MSRYVMNIYCVLSNNASVSYRYYTCELNILGTCIELQFHFLGPRYDTVAAGFEAQTRKPEPPVLRPNREKPSPPVLRPNRRKPSQ
jgi:hypothetical protein